MFDHVCLFLDLIESQEYWWGLDRIRISTVCRRMHCIQMLSCIVQIHLFNDIVNVFHWRWLQQTLGNADLWLNSLKSTIIGKVLARVLSCSSIFSESEVVLLRLSKHGHLAQVPVSVPTMRPKTPLKASTEASITSTVSRSKAAKEKSHTNWKPPNSLEGKTWQKN